MGNTSRLQLPYPGLTDAPNAPSQIQALATALDNLRANALVSLNANQTPFSSDGFVYNVPFVSSGGGFLNGGTSLATSYRLVIPKTATYSVFAQARLTRAAASTTAPYLMQIRKNSAESAGTGSPVLAARGPAAADTTLSTSTLHNFTLGDYVQMFVTGLSGSTLQSSAFDTFIALKAEFF
jgi:hypothetical protein